ncbi:MAG TPA: hypothetical protein VFS67_08695 [Polyangiaceae bacterium]|nr:hypothetical protein [Polyangiaceae bacterium]
MAWASSGSCERVAALGLGFAWLWISLPGKAEAAPEREWLRWQGPIECQNTREVERQIESLLGHTPDPAQLPPTRVEVSWAQERSWTLRIRVALPAGERRREVDVRTCADGFDVVALTLALILDPDLELGEEPAGLDAGEVSPVATEAPAPVVEPAPVAVSAPAPSNASSIDDAASDGADLAGATKSGPRTAPRLSLSASGRADFGSLPSSLYGGGLDLSFAAAQWRLDLGGAFLGKAGDQLPTARYPVSYSNLFGSLRGCREFGGDRGGHFGVCAGGQLGSVGASEQGGERRSPRGLWAAATLGAELGLDLSDSWGAFSRVELVFPFAHHELELAGGSVVHELPTASLQLTLGAAVLLTDWASR